MSKKIPTKMKNFITEMFEEGKLTEILDRLNDFGYFDDNDDCFDDGEYNSKIIKHFIEIIESTAEEYNQESFIFNGYNGVYPIITAGYHMFEPSKETEMINMKKLINNQMCEDMFNLSLCVKEDESKPGLIALFAEPRNAGARVFIWFVE